LYAALSGIGSDLFSPSFHGLRFIPSEWRKRSSVPLDYADKTTIYNLTQPVSSTANGEVAVDPVRGLPMTLEEKFCKVEKLGGNGEKCKFY